MKAVQILRDPKCFWALWGLIGVSWQANSLKTHNGATGSETTRAIWKTHTKRGKRAFLAAFYGGSVGFILWFPHHIVDRVEDSLSILSPPAKDNDNGN